MNQDTAFQEVATYDDGSEIKVYAVEYPNQQARIAIDLVSKWGIVAARVDGEDSTGRQKLRNIDAEELARVACDAAAALWMQLRQRGWMLDIPMPKPGERARLTKSLTKAAGAAANEPL